MTTKREYVETREAEIRAVDDGDGRTIEFIAVPYNEETNVLHRGQRLREVVEPGAFQIGENDVVTINRDHDYSRTIGKVTTHRDEERGLVVEAHISETPLGDETLALARDGVLRASVGMFVRGNGHKIRDGLRRIFRATLDHIALLPNPAYQGTKVLAVREHAPDFLDSGEVADTGDQFPNLNAIREIRESLRS